jgi:hypothetical protein
MAKFHVTLQAELTHGTLYWVADVDARDEDEAMQVAEGLFIKEMEKPEEWAFSAADVEAG